MAALFPHASRVRAPRAPGRAAACSQRPTTGELETRRSATARAPGLVPRTPRRSASRAVATFCIGLCACADSLPEDVRNYRADCVQMNRAPLPRRDDDPHDGEKDVFACNVPLAQLEENRRPFPDGAIIVKESTQPDLDYPWLVATARKRGGGWTWNEYTRNFESEDFLEIAPGESVCIDCHRRVQQSDWIYTRYVAR